MWPGNHRFDDNHGSAAGRAGDCRPLLLVSDNGSPSRDPQHQLKETDEFFAACMEETIRPCPAKSSGQHMKHEQV
ncbi:MAG: hypothetical protein K9L59_01020, partial [Desulfobacterales bacterium]|nr:hypothetical protein [Desulfobacterales bacterium]